MKSIPQILSKLHTNKGAELTANEKPQNSWQTILNLPYDPCQNQQLQHVQRPCPVPSVVQSCGFQEH